jgi:hypothetical protein
MAAADEYQECAALSVRLGEIVPQDQDRWRAMAARWAVLATRAREARTPHYRRGNAALVVASNATADEAALHDVAIGDAELDDIFAAIEESLDSPRVLTPESSRNGLAHRGPFALGDRDSVSAGEVANAAER